MTLFELTRDVYDEMGVATPPYNVQLAVKKALIRAHIRVIGEEKLNHARADLAFVADDPDVALPADFLEIRNIRRGAVVMREITDETYASLRAGEQSSSIASAFDGPTSYVMKEPGRITVWPTPTASSTTGAELWYVAQITKMATAGDTPAGIPEPWHELLVYMVVAKLGPKDVRQWAMQMADQMRAELHNHVSDRTGDDSNRIRLKGFIGR